MTVILSNIAEWSFGLRGRAIFSDGKQFEFWGYGDKANTPRFHHARLYTANGRKLPLFNKRSTLVQDALNTLVRD